LAIKTYTIEAEDIAFGRVQLWVDEGGDLRIQRPYHFVDAQGERVDFPGAEGGIFEDALAWGSVPQAVRDALAVIDQYSKEKINEMEGLK
jgi:hypothetical protein